MEDKMTLFKNWKCIKILLYLAKNKNTNTQNMCFDLRLSYAYGSKLVKLLTEKKIINKTINGREKKLLLTEPGNRIANLLIKIDQELNIMED